MYRRRLQRLRSRSLFLRDMPTWKEREIIRLELAMEELRVLQGKGTLTPTQIAKMQKELLDAVVLLENSKAEIQQEPFIGYKRCCISSDPLSFYGVGVHRAYGTEDDATCNTHDGRYRNKHEAPQVDCSCGFYAVKKEYLAMTRRDYSRAVADLVVEMSGMVVVHKKGYRAGHQRVMGIYLDNECKAFRGMAGYNHREYCGRPAEGMAVDSDADLLPLCRECRLHHRVFKLISPADLANHFKVEVRWGSATDA